MVVAVKNRAISMREARMYYGLRTDGRIVGWTPKCASTFLRTKPEHQKVVGIAEAAAHDGPVVLIVRHPLDRLVSNWIFWTRVHKTRPHVEDPIAAETLGNKSTPFERWHEVADRPECWNPHWVDQTELHTYEGKFVANTTLPWEVLSTLREDKVNATERTAWQDYYTPEFRAAMEERYLADVTLYEEALASWDGKRPPYL